MNRRNDNLDALRGGMLILIVIDHVPSLVGALSYQFLGFVSFAEGFVLLSGFVLGHAYHHRLGRQNMFELQRHGAARALKIYIYQAALISVILIGLLVGFFTQERFQSWMPLFCNQPLKAFILGILLVYQPRFLDVLPMYCLFNLAAPAVVKAFSKGGALAVLIVSLAIWICAQCGLTSKAIASLLPNNLLDLGDFDLFGWQLLFVTGLLFGYYNNARLESEQKSRRFLTTCVLLSSGLFMLRHLDALSSLKVVFESFAIKKTLGPLRILNALALFSLFAYSFTRWGNFGLQKPLAFLGRHSLQVFTTSTLWIFFWRQLTSSFFEVTHGALAVIGVAFGIPVLFAAAWGHELWQNLASDPSTNRNRLTDSYRVRCEEGVGSTESPE
jgi:hypothetical protein